MSNQSQTINEMYAEFDNSPTEPETDTQTVVTTQHAVTQTPTVSKFRKEIDLGDGSGVQVFEGNSWQEVSDKLAEAQTHATRKIRQLNRSLKRTRREAREVEVADTPSQPIQSTVLSAEELRNLGTAVQSDPLLVVDRIVEAKTGLSLDALAQELAQLREEREQQAAVAQFEQDCYDFVEDHPEYFVSPMNHEKILYYIERNRLSYDRDSIEEAYETLSSDGLLEKRPSAPPVAQPAQPRIETRPVPNRVSTLSDTAHPTPSQPASTADVVEDMYNLPLDQLRKRIASGHYRQAAE